LIEKAQLGDPLAISDLLVVCQTDIRRYAEKNCRISDIEDAAQESMLVISQKITKLKAIEAFSRWLFVIVKRECHRALRLIYRRKEIESLAPAGVSNFEDLGLKRDLIKSLESLPPHYLQVILLRDFEELSVKEIAELLSEDVPAIKSRIHRAREMIREYLNPES